jgi:ParB-like chromosome segregation protein Spo0J
MNHPINNIQWIDVDTLKMNDYNPNHVIGPEFDLLKSSLIKQGWIQPLLITPEGVLIDGFHRHYLCKKDPDVRALTGGKVPCAVIDIPESERKMLTVRINRAKGVHSAVKMHELVSDLYNNDKLTVEQICEGIGATKDEVDLLLKESVFKKLDIEHHNYSEAWSVKDEESWYEARNKLRKEGKTEEEILEIIGENPKK